MKVKRMGITEILRRICLFPANKIKSSESFSKQPTQLIVELNSSLRHIIFTQVILTYLWTMCSFILIRYETFGGVTITEASYSSSNLLGPFIYYVSTFSDIFEPLLSIRAVLKVIKN